MPIIKKVDKLRRVRIPQGYLEILDVKEGDEVEIVPARDQLIIRKPVFGCIFCGAGVRLVRVGDLCVCRRCVERLSGAPDNGALYITKID